MAEDWVKDTRSEAKAEFNDRSKIEKEVVTVKEGQAKLSEQLKEAVRARDSSEAGLKNVEKQAEEQCKQLHYTEINLATEKQLVKELREELQKAREAAQLVKEAAETEKQATYTLGVGETQAKLTEELSTVCREYCGISWGKALDAAGVPVGFDLRRLKSIYYDPEIRELPGPNSSHPEQATQAFEQSMANQALPVLLEVPKESNQDGGQGKKAEDLKGMGKGQDKKKNSSNPKEKAPDTATSQLGQTVDPVVSKTTAQDMRRFLLFLFVFCCVFFF